MNDNICFRRIFAFLIDWNISGLPCLLYTIIFKDYFGRATVSNIWFIVCFLLLIILFPVVFVLRDVIWNGRSIGKRIFGLYVIDKRTNVPATCNQRIIRNLFFFIYLVDGIILLASKESLGDRVANTAVIR